ncbi:HNH endonuclease family protein [Amycolatopsis sp. CA-128772]|uniref:HNH endonuclease family protein n=1 Tax=Amycolatopsis sp. CA-128772 TaxID=2073159 RepID=UPI000CCFF339|nr:HNH endonuclease family protein [Amycolatopsis sp. CA-128772]
MNRTLTALALVTTVVATPAGCDRPAPPASSSATSVGSTGTPGLATARVDVAAVRAELAALTVSAEDTGNHYRRADWPHWDQVGGGCDARENALRTQGAGVRVGAGCRITGGTWISPYDGVTVTTPGALDIDHLVPLAEAARSGTRAWSIAQRERYANDPGVLVAVTAKSNRSKGDQDPARWLPARDRCGYVARWVAVKHRYGMTVDRAERAAITGVLNHC